MCSSHMKLLGVHPPNDPALRVSLAARHHPVTTGEARPLQQARLCGRAPVRQEPKPLTALLEKQGAAQKSFSLRVLHGTRRGEGKAEMKGVQVSRFRKNPQHCHPLPETRARSLQALGHNTFLSQSTHRFVVHLPCKDTVFKATLLTHYY